MDLFVFVRREGLFFCFVVILHSPVSLRIGDGIDGLVEREQGGGVGWMREVEVQGEGRGCGQKEEEEQKHCCKEARLEGSNRGSSRGRGRGGGRERERALPSQLFLSLPSQLFFLLRLDQVNSLFTKSTLLPFPPLSSSSSPLLLFSSLPPFSSPLAYLPIRHGKINPT